MDQTDPLAQSKGVIPLGVEIQPQSFSKVMCEGNVAIPRLHSTNPRTHSLFQHSDLILQAAVAEGRRLFDALQGKELPSYPLLHQENF